MALGLSKLLLLLALTDAANGYVTSAEWFEDSPNGGQLTTQIRALELHAAKDLEADLAKHIREFLPLPEAGRENQVVVQAQVTVKVDAQSSLTTPQMLSRQHRSQILANDALAISSVHLQIGVRGHAYPAELMLRLSTEVRRWLARRGFSINNESAQAAGQPQATITITYDQHPSPTPVSMLHVFVGAAVLSMLALMLLIRRQQRVPEPHRSETMPIFSAPENPWIGVVRQAPHPRLQEYAADPDLRISPLRGTWHIQSLAFAPDAIVQRIFRSLPAHAALAVLRRLPANDRQVILDRMRLQTNLRSRLDEELVIPESQAVRRARRQLGDAATRAKLAQCSPSLLDLNI